MATIMIVEDEQAIALLLKYNLEKNGYETITVAHGNRVLSAVEKHLPSLILLDWMLPEISGLELCKIIRNNPELKNIPIIMLTAKSQDIRLDAVEKKVFRGENYIRLGPTEFRILKLLIANPRHVFSREDLLREVWGNSVYVETRTVDVHIRRLRKALNEFGADYIRTIRATGYSIDDHEVEAEQ